MSTPMKTILFAILLCFSLVACEQRDFPANSNQQQAAQQEQLSQQSNAIVGMPGINNFTEKRMMKTILEKRDDAKLATHTYVLDMQGHYHKVCDSLGYGLPYATQFTNPQRVEYYSSGPQHTGNYTLPQADPNGLFSPAAADGTWVMCVNAEKSQTEVQYIEDRIGVFTIEPLNIAK